MKSKTRVTAMSIEHGQKVATPAAPKSLRTGPESHSFASKILTAILFWSLCLTLAAAGHRLYKATVTLDRTISAARYQTDGVRVVWVGHGSLDDAYMRLGEEQRTMGLGRITSLPNSIFWISATIGFTTLAGLMAWSGRCLFDDGIQSLTGIYAGHFLWLGAVEFGLDAAGRRIGLANSLEVVGNRVVGTHGAGSLIQLSVVFLVPLLFGLALHESNRCAWFQWLRRRLPLTRSSGSSGRVENYVARTAIQYFMTVWFCYVGVLWLADPILGRFGEIALLITMLAIVSATPYMIWRTAKQSRKPQALRYAVSGSVVTWTAIEIAAAMAFFDEPWLANSLASGVLLLGLTAVLTVLAFYSLRGFQPPRVPQGAFVLVAVLIAGTLGCSSSNQVEPMMTPATLRQLLEKYENRIQPPDSAMSDGLLHALYSHDAETKAQAAIAFGKCRRVNRVVKDQLQTIALTDESRLSQYAALRALIRLRAVSPAVQRLLSDVQNDEQWGVVMEATRK